MALPDARRCDSDVRAFDLLGTGQLCATAMGRVDRSSDPWAAVAAGGLSAQELPPAGVGVPRRHRWDAVTLERLAVRLASSSKLGGMGAQTGAVGGGDQLPPLRRAVPDPAEGHRHPLRQRKAARCLLGRSTARRWDRRRTRHPHGRHQIALIASSAASSQRSSRSRPKGACQNSYHDPTPALRLSGSPRPEHSVTRTTPRKAPQQRPELPTDQTTNWCAVRPRAASRRRRS